MIAIIIGQCLGRMALGELIDIGVFMRDPTLEIHKFPCNCLRDGNIRGLIGGNCTPGCQLYRHGEDGSCQE